MNLEAAKPVGQRLLDELRQDASGARVLAEWLGSGGYPVSASQANDRALICLNCHENRPERWWEKAKDAIARAIREHLLVKGRLELKVAVEEEIGMCRRCGCCIRLLVWTPIEHLKRHHSKVNGYPSFCWKRNEIETL